MPGYYKRNGTVPESWQTKGEVTPTYFVRPYVEDYIDRESRVADISVEGNRPIGGLRILAEQTAPFYEKATAESIARRIHMVLTEEQASMNIHLADCLLMAMDKFIEHEPVPTLPGGITAARRMVHEWHRATDRKIGLPEAEELAKKMLHITKGLLYTEELSERVEAADAA